MEQSARETPARFQTREKPGWMAIALIATFVLAAVAMFLIGARLVKRTPGRDLSAVAVLPFAGETVATNFSAGLKESLGNNDRLRVVDTQGAGVWIEGSMQQSGIRVRVVARLVRSADRNVLWAHTYDFGVNDAGTVQAEIARQVTATILLYQRVPQQ